MTAFTQTNFDWVSVWQQSAFDNHGLIVLPQNSMDMFVSTEWSEILSCLHNGSDSLVTEFDDFIAPPFAHGTISIGRTLPGLFLPDIHLALDPKKSFYPLQRLNRAPTVIPTLKSLSDEIKQYQGDYVDGWDGPYSKGPSADAAKAALTAIEKIPTGMMLPRTMLSPNGELGLYWDMAAAYADMSFDANGHITFFARNQRSEERFEDLDQGDLDTNWYWRNIGTLNSLALAA